MLLAYIGIAIMGATAFYLGTNLFGGELAGAAASRLEQKKRKPTLALQRIFQPFYLGRA
jgi:hypothetical protein